MLDEIDIPLAELGLRFVLSNPDISTVLMGARSPQEVEQNVAAAERGPLAPELLQRLDEIAAMVPFRPYEEPSCCLLAAITAGPVAWPEIKLVSKPRNASLVNNR
jgi:predicted aldo/keto reductase-like oxidoreductase